MKRFRMIRNNLWDDPRFLKLTNDAKIVYIYLLSGPYSTMISGVSVNPVARVAVAVGVTADCIGAAYANLIESGMMLFDEACGLVLLPYELMEIPPEGWKQLKGCMECLMDLPKSPIREDIMEIIKESVEQYDGKDKEDVLRILNKYNDTLSKGYRWGISDRKKEDDTPSIGYKTLSYTPSIPIHTHVHLQTHIQPQSQIHTHTFNKNELELQLLPNTPPAPSVVDKVSDDKKKSIDSSAKKKQEEQIYWMKNAYEQWYMKRFRVEQDKLPPWGSVERGACKRLIGGTISVDRILELIPEYFKWQNQQVINAGYPFASGYASFCQKIHELIADMANPERRQISQILAFKEKTDHAELKRQNEIEEMRRMMQEHKDAQERKKMM